jgi:hypothetical protein
MHEKMGCVQNFGYKTSKEEIAWETGMNGKIILKWILQMCEGLDQIQVAENRVHW